MQMQLTGTNAPLTSRPSLAKTVQRHFFKNDEYDRPRTVSGVVSSSSANTPRRREGPDATYIDESYEKLEFEALDKAWADAWATKMDVRPPGRLGSKVVTRSPRISSLRSHTADLDTKLKPDVAKLQIELTSGSSSPSPSRAASSMSTYRKGSRKDTLPDASPTTPTRLGDSLPPRLGDSGLNSSPRVRVASKTKSKVHGVGTQTEAIAQTTAGIQVEMDLTTTATQTTCEATGGGKDGKGEASDSNESEEEPDSATTDNSPRRGDHGDSPRIGRAARSIRRASTLNIDTNVSNFMASERRAGKARTLHSTRFDLPELPDKSEPISPLSPVAPRRLKRSASMTANEIQLHRQRSKSVLCVRMSDSARKTKRDDPVYWGISIDQLEEFDHSIHEDMQDYCQCHKWGLKDNKWIHKCVDKECEYADHEGATFEYLEADRQPLNERTMKPNMYVVVDRYVRPRTKEGKCGFALMVNPRGLQINIFVSHTWAEPFTDFLAALKAAVTHEDALWVCSFALDQNRVDWEDYVGSADLDRSHFARALRFSHRLLVVMDAHFELIRRTWCTYEIAMAVCWNVPQTIWFFQPPSIEDFTERIAIIDIQQTEASSTEDAKRIVQAIESHKGIDIMNERLRATLLERLTCFTEGSTKHKDEIEEITGKMKELLRGKSHVLSEADKQELYDLQERFFKIQYGLEGADQETQARQAQRIEHLKIENSYEMNRKDVQKEELEEMIATYKHDLSAEERMSSGLARSLRQVRTKMEAQKKELDAVYVENYQLKAKLAEYDSRRRSGTAGQAPESPPRRRSGTAGQAPETPRV